MSYDLGIDLGTTFTAAATARGGRTENVGLGNRSIAAPSVVFVQNGTVLAGEAASRRAASDPDHVAREFKRRIGDSVPLILGGAPFSAQQLTSYLLRWVVDRVSEREGGPPDRIALTHPANWGPFKRDLLQQAVRLAELDDVMLITEPEAAAIEYASLERVEPGSVVAVYDLGGGTFDAAVLKKTVEGFEVLGTPEGVEHLGGIDFDEAVFLHVLKQLPKSAVEGIDRDSAATTAALQRLRQDCVEAKEALSSDTVATIHVMIPGLEREIRLTRGELEAMIRPALHETIAALRRAMRSADVDAEDLHRVLLVGGSSRIPLVAQLVGDELRRPVAVDTDPKNAISLGAARAAALVATNGDATTAPVAVAPPPPPPPVAAAAPVAPVAVAPAPPVERVAPTAPPPPPPAPAPPPPPPAQRPAAPQPSRRTGVLVAAIAAAVLLIGGAAFFLTSSGDDNGEEAESTATDAGPPTGEPTVRWTVDTGGRISSTPVVADGRVYAATQVSDKVVAIDAENGELVWEFDAGGSVFGATAVDDEGTVYTGSYVGAIEGQPDTDGQGAVTAIEGETGEQRWRFDVGAVVQSSPLVSGGVVYVGADDNNLYAIDAATGQPVWTFATGDIVRSSPAIAEGILYVGSNDGNLYAIDPASGQEVWRATVGQADYSSPTVADGVVYIGNNAGVVSAVDAATGAPVWSFPTGGTVGCRPAVADGSVYFGSFDGNVYALTTSGGGERWRFEVQLEEPLFSSPSVVDGIVYIGSHARKVFAIDAPTGEEVWQFETGGIVGSSPTIADGVLYVGSDDGNVYALELPA
jgi:outer membrane protein assembly factor BamB/actin-like ATPase involved in cell morphogenesis